MQRVSAFVLYTTIENTWRGLLLQAASDIVWIFSRQSIVPDIQMHLYLIAKLLWGPRLFHEKWTSWKSGCSGAYNKMKTCWMNYFSGFWVRVGGIFSAFHSLMRTLGDFAKALIALKLELLRIIIAPARFCHETYILVRNHSEENEIRLKRLLMTS